MNQKEVGKKIKSIRESQGLTREEFAKKLNVSTYTIANYEQGQRGSNMNTLKKIAEALGVPVDMILFDENAKNTIEDAANKSANHIVEHIYPLAEYVNQNRFQGKYNIKEVFSSSELIDLGGLIDDVVANRLLHAVNKNKNK